MAQFLEGGEGGIGNWEGGRGTCFICRSSLLTIISKDGMTDSCVKQVPLTTKKVLICKKKKRKEVEKSAKSHPVSTSLHNYNVFCKK